MKDKIAKNLWLFGIAFAISLSLQTIYWRQTLPVDYSLWTDRAQSLQVDLSSLQPISKLSSYSGHPGTPVLLGAIAINKVIGTPLDASVLRSVAIASSLLVAHLAVLVSFIIPNRYLWAFIAIIFSYHPLHFFSTPTTIVISLATLNIYCLVWILQKYRTDLHLKFLLLIIIATLTGLSLATITALTIVYLLPLIPIALKSAGLKRSIYTILLAIIVSIALNPLLWIYGADHLAEILFGAPSRHVAFYSPEQISFSYLFSQSPLTLLITFCLIYYAFLLLFHKTTRSNNFLAIFLSLITVWYLTIFTTANFQSMRYIYPLILTLDLVMIIVIPQILVKIVDYLQRIPSLKTGSMKIVFTAIIALFFLVLTSSHLHSQVSKFGPDTSGQAAVYNERTLEELNLAE